MTHDITERVPAGSCHLCEPVEGNYFVATYPPFSTWTRLRVADAVRMIEDPHTFSPDTPLGLYIHIPFCVKRCDYCYYLSSAGSSPERIEEYVDLIAEELHLYESSAVLRGRLPSFVYFGGGTPSILTERSIARLMEAMKDVAPWSAAREVSFECAPKTVTEGKLVVLRDQGVTRVSLGVQAMDDDVLRANARIHLTGDIEKAYHSMRRVGFPTVNVDLIVGLVGETDASFFAGVERVIAMAPDSVTIYQLEIPLNTPLHRATRDTDDPPTPASWEVKRRRLSEAFDRLEASGYHVRSGYAAVRDPDRHPFVYQDAQYRGADLLGLGLSSFSYLGGVHFQNETSDAAHADAVRAGTRPINRAYVLDDDERLIREFVLGLKLGAIEPRYFLDKFGVDVRARFRDELAGLMESGMLRRDRDRIELTRAGLLRVDRLLPRFYRPCHRDIRYS